MSLKDESTHSDLFKKTFEKYAKSMFLYALSFVNTEMEAEDIVQEVFYNYWKNDTWKKVQSEAVKTYLFRSVKNTCLNHQQKKEVMHNWVEIENDTMLEEDEDFQEELIQQIYQTIEEMPPQTREIIKSVFYKNQKYQEVADQMGISVNTVKTLLRRAMHHLREQYSDSMVLFLIFNK